MTPSAGKSPKPGLRERKKAKTRAAIQTHALRLFRKQGYRNTTVDQIIDAAEVSETTFFRYFPTKEDVILQDDLDPMILETLLRQPAEMPPIQAIRATFREFFAQASSEQHREMRDRISLVIAEPSLRATMLDQYSQAILMLAEVLAERLGRNRNDLAIRSIAGAAVGAMMATMMTLVDTPEAELPDVLDQALGYLEHLDVKG